MARFDAGDMIVCDSGLEQFFVVLVLKTCCGISQECYDLLWIPKNEDCPKRKVVRTCPQMSYIDMFYRMKKDDE